MDHFVGSLCLLLFDLQRLYAGFDTVITEYKGAFKLAYTFVPLLKMENY